MLEFSEDMLPRHFPNVHRPNTKQSDESAVIRIPRPSLPSVSLIYSNDTNVKPYGELEEVKKEQHRTKSVKKQVIFAGKTEQYKSIGRVESFGIRSNLELSFFESHQHGRLHQPFRITTEVNHKMTKEPPKSECVNRSPFQMNFQQYGHGLQTKKENCFARSPLVSNRDDQPKFLENSMPEPKRFGDHGMYGEQRRQLQSCAETLLNVLEEQQRHIAIQQNQILMQEKQSLEQQKQICMLECQIEKLLLQNEADDIHSLHSAELDTANVFKTENITTEPMNLEGCGASMGYRDDHSNSTNFGIGDMIRHFGLSDNKEHNGYMYNGRVRTLNSAIFDYEFNGTASTTSHINFTTQTSICETSTNCVSYNQSQIARDQSFVFNMLEKKYKCSEGQGSLYKNPQYNEQSSRKGHNEYSEDDVPSEMLDYFVRHGLIKR